MGNNVASCFTSLIAKGFFENECVNGEGRFNYNLVSKSCQCCSTPIRYYNSASKDEVLTDEDYPNWMMYTYKALYNDQDYTRIYG